MLRLSNISAARPNLIHHSNSSITQPSASSFSAAPKTQRSIVAPQTWSTGRPLQARAFNTSPLTHTRIVEVNIPKEPQPLIDSQTVARIPQSVQVRHQKKIVQRAFNKLGRYQSKKNAPVERLVAVPYDLQVLGVRPPRGIYMKVLDILESYSAAGRAGYQMLQEAVKQGYRPNKDRYLQVLEMCAVEGGDALAEGQELFQSMEKTQRCLVAMTRLYARGAPKEDSGLDLFKQALKKKRRPGVDMWTAVMELYERRGNRKGVQDTFDRMVRNKVKPNVEAFNRLLKSFSMPKKKELAINTFEKMRQEDVLRTDETYTIIMEKMLQCKDHARVEYYYRRMLKAEVQPNEDTLTVALQSAHRNNANIRFALRVLRDSKRLGIPRTEQHMELIRQIKREKAQEREREIQKMQEEVREYRRQRAQQRNELLRQYTEDQKHKAAKLKKKTSK
eukprot:gb/GECH01012850.1/.p1 GENE.gb/GECH01012850.1/~~gb/GECH01012850.1/.p1  ORF type:complete len:447 (+),score=56.32 gb/GECH01012850.1/:1-1341(+)